jgi:hypothetical protein
MLRQLVRVAATKHLSTTYIHKRSTCCYHQWNKQYFLNLDKTALHKKHHEFTVDNNKHKINLVIGGTGFGIGSGLFATAGLLEIDMHSVVMFLIAGTCAFFSGSNYFYYNKRRIAQESFDKFVQHKKVNDGDNKELDKLLNDFIGYYM